MSAGDEKRKRALVMSRVNRVRRRLDLELSLKLLPVPLWVCATAFLVYRVGIRTQVAAAAGVLLLVALLWVRAQFAQRRVDMSQAAVIADRLSGAQGLLLTRLEVPVGAWELGLNERLRDVPPVSIEVKKSGALAFAALVFFVVAALVPLPERRMLVRNAAGETRVEELAQKLEAVAKEEPVDDAARDVLESLQKELEDGRFDAADWEAADALEAELDKKAMEAQAELERAQEAAKAYQEALAQGASGEAQAREREALEQALLSMSDGSASSGSEALQQAMESAERQAQHAQKSGEQSQNGQQSQQGQQGQNGEQGQQNGQQGQNGQNGQNGQQQGQNGKSGQQGPSRSQTDSLKDALSRRQQQLQNSMGQSGQQQRSAQNRSGQQRSGQGQGQGQQQGQEGQGQGQGQQQGHGQSGQSGEGHASRQGSPGTGRGPGEGNLVFGDQAEMDPNRLAFAPLPEGQGGEAGELWGLQRSDPKKPGASNPRSSGSTTGTTGTSAPANREGELLPRNRQLIQRYFDSKP